MSIYLRPEEIEAESFRLIELEIGGHPWSRWEWPVVRRAIHTTADFDYSRTMVFSPDSVVRGIATLRAGQGIVTDTTMALAGINKTLLRRFDARVSCRVADPDVAAEAKRLGVTRSIIAMRRATAEAVTGGIFVIGNAPTALFELLRVVKEGFRPDLVIALPVGFVGAAESKEALIAEGASYGLPFITNRGRKGGSNVAAAVVNALMILAAQ